MIIPIEAAEAAVAEHRRYLDATASWGVPAHVSVLWPFMHPSTIDIGVISRLRSAVGSVQAFDCTFARCDWFGDDVLWLAPEPDQPFQELTSSAVWHAFPDHPPYGGAFDDIVPHLTVGERSPLSALRDAAESVSHQLPITAHIERAVLIAGTAEPDSWRTVHEFPLPVRTA